MHRAADWDTDGDGVPNFCDACPGSDDAVDGDLDGVPDACDNCALTPNAAQSNGDGDAYGDACDVCVDVVDEESHLRVTAELPGMSRDDVQLSQAAHGCSVVRVAKDSNGKWDVVFDDRNRRITVNTPVEFDGPVAGTDFLENEAGNEPLGTVNNCAGGITPWGTWPVCGHVQNSVTMVIPALAHGLSRNTL